MTSAARPRLFFDTSVLVQSVVDYGPETQASRALVQRAVSRDDVEGVTARHCLLEWYAVTTRLPEPYRLSAPLALRVLRESFLPRLALAPEQGFLLGDFLGELEADGVTGGRVYDAYIATLARLSGATTVVTENRRHFVSLLRHGVRVVTAAEYLSP